MADKPPLPPEPIPDLKRSSASLDELQAKLRQLVDDFANGVINRAQFHELYDRYHRQIERITQLCADPADMATVLGQEGEDTIALKKRLTARVLGVSIYSNQSGLPIETLGDFAIDPALLVPMLSSYRDATREIFKAGMRSTAMENNEWLCFVPGNFTTLIALFSVEPSAMQFEAMSAMHHDFEDANRAALEEGNVDPATLAYPFLTFMRKVHHQHSITGTMRPVPRSDPTGK